jgi:putative nucleotidyltransferase with HDIG domain
MIRIVFVDDDENLLHAMRRAMRGMTQDWEMEFLVSGALALKTLAINPADVIVSDMRMPGMDGWQLLTEVKRLYPQTVRLVLSGHSDPGAIMRLVGTAHQYMTKPGNTAALKTAIAQTQLLKSLVGSEQLARMVGQVSTLPSCPQAFAEISQCLRRPSATVADAARIISRDVAMTANVMKLVNSAFFGIRRTIASIDRAVAYLGLDTLGALVLGHDLFRKAATGCAGPDEQLWSHSFKTAVAARAIAVTERLSPSQAEEAFLTGMLHDVGKIIMATQRSALELKEGAEVPIDLHHAQVGAYLLGLWGFPSQIVAAVALHHTPRLRADKGFDLTTLIHVADRLTRWQGTGEPTLQELDIETGLLEELGLSERLPAWWNSMAVLEEEQVGS